MWQKNDGTGEANILHNQFTAYLMTAIKRRKISYLKEKSQLYQMELALELCDVDAAMSMEADFSSVLPILEQIENPLLLQALQQAKERELYIFLTRILDERSFVELSNELGISYKAATNSYYRFLDRIKELLKGGDVS